MGCRGLVQALKGLLAVPEPVGLGPAADAPRLPCLCWALLPALATSEGRERKADGECGRLLLISFSSSLLFPQASPGRTGHGVWTALTRPWWGLEGERHHTPAKGPPNQRAVTPPTPHGYSQPGVCHWMWCLATGQTCRRAFAFISCVVSLCLFDLSRTMTFPAGSVLSPQPDAPGVGGPMGHCVTCQGWMWSHCHFPPGWGSGVSNQVEAISWKQESHVDEDLAVHQCSSLGPQP